MPGKNAHTKRLRVAIIEVLGDDTLTTTSIASRLEYAGLSEDANLPHLLASMEREGSLKSQRSKVGGKTAVNLWRKHENGGANVT